MKFSQPEFSAVQQVADAADKRHEGWSNSATFTAEMVLHADKQCFDAINKLAFENNLTGQTLQDYVFTLRAKRFCPDGKKVPGCGIHLPDWVEGKVNWDEIAADWNATTFPENAWTPKDAQAPVVPCTPIPQDVLPVLAESTIDETGVLRLPARKLDRKLYEAVNKVLEALGGKWTRKVQGHVFTEHPGDLLETVLQTGTYTKPYNFGFFVTQPPLADETILVAEIEPGMMVLEPSGGTGALALRAAKVVGHANVKVVELLEKNVAVLREHGFDPIHADFLTFQTDTLFDVVVMNPPFAKQADIDHVMHAWNMVRPGGRLVSIMAASVRFRENTKTRLFRELVDNYGHIVDNPDGSFKESGTSVRTVTVVLNRPNR